VRLINDKVPGKLQVAPHVAARRRHGSRAAFPVLAVIAVIAAGCSSSASSSSSSDSSGSSGSSSSLQVVKVAVIPNSVTDVYMPLYAAEDLGIAKANGIDLQFVPVESGSALVTAVVANAATFTGAPITSVAQAIEHGADIQPISAQEQTSGGFILEAKAGIGVTNVKQLAGKTICISEPGSETALYAQYANTTYHLNASLVPVQGSGQVPTLEAGKTAACVEVSPGSYNLLSQKKAVELVNFQQTAPIWATWIAHTGYVASHQALTNSFLKTWYETIAKLQADPSYGVKELEKYNGETPAVAQEEFQALYAHAPTSGGVTAAQVEQTYKVADAAGITGLPSVSQMTTSQFASIHG
jgi:ABC-type nitrate/sulfonate/bicarbonate transport system substrate-binding protein